MYQLTLIAALIFSTIAYSNDVENKLSCDIDKVQTKDWSADLAGYQQDNYKVIFPKWLSKANSGDPKYQFYVAKAYHMGDGTTKSLNKAAYWYQLSSDQNYPVATNNLANMYEYGEGKEQDLSFAFELYCDAALSGLSVSQYNMGRYYNFGMPGLQVSGNLALAWYKLAADGGNIHSIYNAGLIYHYGTIAEKDTELAFSLILKAAEYGDLEAINDIGVSFDNGFGVEKNLDKAINWYKKGSSLSNPKSDYNLYLVYSKESSGKYDFSKALRYLKRSSSLGLGHASLELGDLYFLGELVDRDLNESSEWYLKGAEQGNLDSMAYISEAYSKGFGVEIDEKKGYYWAQNGASSGNPYSQLLLGNIYLFGRGAEKNVTEALKLYEKVFNAETIDANKAQASLGISYVYFFGEGADVDYDKAFVWYQRAANLGNAFAQYQLGYMYREGLGVEINYAKAFKWYKEAVQGGSEQAKLRIAELYEDGNGVIQDGNKAVEIYKELQDSTDTNIKRMSASSMGALYRFGLGGVSVNIEESIKWYRLAAVYGDLYDQEVLADLYITIADFENAKLWLNKSTESGSSVAKDKLGYLNNLDDAESQNQIGLIQSVNGNDESSMYWFEKAAQQGNSDAQNTLAEIHADGIIVPQDYTISLYWLRKSANSGHSMAQNNLGSMHLNGSGVVKNIDEAIKWYELSAKHDNELALRNLGVIFLYERKDYKNALYYLKKAAALGNKYAMINLSELYKDGLGVDKSDKFAFEWMLKAATNSNIRLAMMSVGDMYSKGIGVVKDANKAFTWYNRARNTVERFNTNIETQRDLDNIIDESVGNAYVRGLGVPKDWVKGRTFEGTRSRVMDAEAGTGDAEKMFQIAREYDFDLNVFDKAIYWYKEAAKRGHILAQRAVGEKFSIYTRGNKKDFKTAEYWLNKAISQGDIDSLVSLGRIYAEKDENFGKENPLYNPQKALSLFLSAKNSGVTETHHAINLYNWLSYMYRYAIGTKIDIDKAVSVLIEGSNDEKISKKDKESFIISAFEIQLENKRFDNLVNSKAMSILISSAKSGDSKSQFKLGKVYLNKDFDYYNRDDGMYWLKKSSSRSIAANKYLAEMYFGTRGDDYNHKKHGDSLKRAIKIFEDTSADDYLYFKNLYVEGIIEIYHGMANYYLAVNAPELVEVYLRKSAKHYPPTKNSKHTTTRELILASASSDFESSKKLLLEKIENLALKDNADLVSIDNLYNAVTAMHQKYRDAGRYKDAANFFQEILTKFEGKLDFFKPVIVLEIARDYSRLKDYKATDTYLSIYKETKNANEPGFFEELLKPILYSKDEVEAIESALQSFNNPVERVLYGVLEGIVAINSNNIDYGYDKIIVSLDNIRNFNIPIRSQDLDFAVEPIEMLIDKGEHHKASAIIERVVSLYKDSVILRTRDNYKVSATEKDLIADAISEYIYATTMANEKILDKGFEVMQLSSGLTLSDTLIETITRKQLTGSSYVKSKQLSTLEGDRRDLIQDKFILISGQLPTGDIDAKLDLIDTQINNIRSQLESPNKNVLELFISPLESVQKIMPNNDALITMLIGNKRSHVWLVTNSGIYRHDSSLTKKDIERHSDELLDALNPTNLNKGSFPFDSSAALYSLMIEPFKEHLDGIDRLVITPDASLSKIPFSILTSDLISGSSNANNQNATTRGISATTVQVSSALSEQPEWLIQKYAISTVPSVYAYIELASVNKENIRTMRNFAGIGNPILQGTDNVLTRGGMFGENDIRGNISRSLRDLSPLPESEAELHEIAKMFDSSIILTQDKATEINVRNTDLTEFDVISFATHALVSNEIDDLFEPSLVLTPVQQDNSENDGLLTASEVADLDLDADIVILSACNTASSFDKSNSQGLSGLANSFFQAGAKSLLVSYWSVISESAVDVTTRIFRPANRGRSYAHKHRNAVIDILKDSAGTFRSHPSYWAPFSVIGVQ